MQSTVSKPSPNAPPQPPAPGQPRPTVAAVRAREVIAGAFTGTPGRMRLFSALAVTACLLFGALGFVFANRLDQSLGAARGHAAQLVRVQTIRTSLVKADANATNAFLVGGLEPADSRAGYDDGIRTAAATVADASNANARDVASLRKVNNALSTYTGLIERARANNRLGYPIGAAYLRQASNSLQETALPPLEELVKSEQQRVESASNAARNTQREILVLLALVLAWLLVTQLWLFRRTHRILNPSLVLATALVVVVGATGLVVVGWSQRVATDAQNGPYTETVALATGRINGFDAKSAESLTLIARGSGAAYEARFAEVAGNAKRALASDITALADSAVVEPTAVAFEDYVQAHTALREKDDDGQYDAAVADATGDGAANKAFARFETTSRTALDDASGRLADELGHARFPLLTLSWLLLFAGLVAAFAAGRGFAQRLREYR